jgi:hypothetical protein
MTEPRTDYEKQIIHWVEEAGCFVVSVLPDEHTADLPFSYSVGFTKSLGQPEVILMGLPGETSHSLINSLFERCSDGFGLTDGTRIEEIASFPLVAKEVDESWIIQSFFASALWYHRTQMDSPLVRAMQIVWPDAGGNYPWEADCAEWVRADQPAMYEPRIAA